MFDNLAMSSGHTKRILLLILLCCILLCTQKVKN